MHCEHSREGCWVGRCAGIYPRTTRAARKLRPWLLPLSSPQYPAVTGCAAHTVPLLWEGLLLIVSILTHRNPYYYFVGYLQGGKWHQEQMVRGLQLSENQRWQFCMTEMLREISCRHLSHKCKLSPSLGLHLHGQSASRVRGEGAAASALHVWG